jgi:hypothetical protein
MLIPELKSTATTFATTAKATAFAAEAAFAFATKGTAFTTESTAATFTATKTAFATEATFTTGRTATAETSATATRGAITAKIFVLRFICANLTAVKFGTVERFYSRSGFRFIGHFDKAETLRTVRDTIGDNAGRGDFAICFKCRTKRVICSGICEIADIDIHLG